MSSTSPPERLLFRTYCGLRKLRGPALSVLLPQVYLHFDPMTANMLGGSTRLVRQRMDFLLLLSHQDRIVVEVDGSSTTPKVRGVTLSHRHRSTGR